MTIHWFQIGVGIIIGFLAGAGTVCAFVSNQCDKCALELMRILRIRPESVDEEGAKKWRPRFWR